MIAIVIILFVVLNVIAFKVLRLKVNARSLAISATSGVLVVLGIVMLWSLGAPMSTAAVVTRYVVRIVPWVNGQVRSRPAQPNVPLKKGDVLYQIDPTSYEYTVNQARAQLTVAQDNAKSVETGISVAAASLAKSQADDRSAKAALDVAEATAKENQLAISQLKLAQAREQFAASSAAVRQAEATLNQAKAAVVVAQDTIVVNQSMLDSAQFNLDQCTVRAPADGFVTDWQIREGTYVTHVPSAAAGTFIDTSETYVIASFPAQTVVNVKPGQEVEMAFKSRPGRLFRGTVDCVVAATGEGQFAPGGTLTSAASIQSPGVLAVKIRFNEQEDADALQLGTAGAVVIYTDWAKPMSIISRIAIRLKKWSYFLPF